MGHCSKTCGTGARLKIRSKTVVESHNGSCPGVVNATEACNTHNCPSKKYKAYKPIYLYIYVYISFLSLFSHLHIYAPLFQLMATGVDGANGPRARNIVALVSKIELGIATAHLQLTMVKIVLLMAQVTQRVGSATRKVAQVR